MNDKIDFILNKIEDLEKKLTTLTLSQGGNEEGSSTEQEASCKNYVLLYDMYSDDDTINCGKTTGITTGSSFSATSTTLGSFTNLSELRVYTSFNGIKGCTTIDLGLTSTSTVYYPKVFADRLGTTYYAVVLQINSAKTSLGFLRTTILNMTDTSNISSSIAADKTLYFIYKIIGIKTS